MVTADPTTSTIPLDSSSGRMPGDNATIASSHADDRPWEKYIWIYSLPVIFLIGVTGNVFTILVMRRSRMRGTATSVYLTLLAIADTSVLVTGVIPEWLIQTEIKDIGEVDPWICKFERFFFYTTGDVAVWILVAFTCDRCIAVCFPLKKRHLCTARRAYLACLLVLLIAVAKNLHVFWTRGATYDDDGELVENCSKPEPYVYFEKKVRPWIVMATVSLGPFVVILACNAIIVRQLVWSGRVRSSAGDDRRRAFTQTTAMCLSTSLAFLVLITPSIVLLIGKPYWTSSVRPNVAYDVAKAVNNQLMFVNHSINFLLYCMTGARFRAEFVGMFGRRRPTSDAGRTPRTTQPYSGSAPRSAESSALSRDDDLRSNGYLGPNAKGAVYVIDDVKTT